MDVEVLRSEFENDYDVGLKFPPRDDTGISIQAESARELRVRSDTLTAFMSPFRVVLAQRERAPFTRRDMYLRGRVIELYPQSRPTPFPWLFSGEPEFEVEEERKASDW